MKQELRSKRYEIRERVENEINKCATKRPRNKSLIP